MSSLALFADPFPKHQYDQHSVYYLSAYLKTRGIDAKYVQDADYSQLTKKIQDVNPDLVLYTGFTTHLDTLIDFDRYAKQHINIKSLIGGPGPTFDQDFLQDSTFDSLCIGEGEYALADYFDSGLQSAKNIVHRENREDFVPMDLVPDLDDLPFPDRSLVYDTDPLLKNLHFKYFMTGRGCPYVCTYCYNNLYNKMFKGQGKIIRKKSVDYMIAEMNDCHRQYPFKTAILQDDTFIFDKKWLFEWCERYPIEVGIPYTCLIRANLVDEDVVIALKESGCVAVTWSIESGNEHIRNKVLKHTMSDDQILQTAEWLNKHKLKHCIPNIVGIPGEKWENVIETLELTLKCKPYMTIANIYTPFKGLDLTNYALAEGHLSADFSTKLNHNSFFADSVLDMPDAYNKKLQKIVHLFPLVVAYPFLYNNKLMWKSAFKVPLQILSGLRVLTYAVRVAALYRIHAFFTVNMSLFFREIKRNYYKKKSMNLV